MTINNFTELSKSIMEDREKRAKTLFIDEVINLLARGIKLYDLSPDYAYSVAMWLIKESGLNDEEKNQHREHFANAVIFTGITGLNTLDFNSAIEARDSIIKKLEEE